MSEEENTKFILDLSKKQLKKVPKMEDAQNVRSLILDENELQKIDNIDSYLKIEKLSLSKNQLLRMYGVCRLHCLRELTLSFNGILSIEGLKDCQHLRMLNLEGNNIKTIEHLNHNTKLEYLNLAENSIGSIADISFLKCLKELYLHGNRLTHLRHCDKHLPISLETLTLAKNNISDLNEICTLSNLCNLQSITINDNPCVTMTAGPDGFDHRPFVLNWCLSVKAIDGFMVDPIESLKAEWLYSQGRGRQFRLGEQTALAKYLSSVCPLIGKALENENERKLRLILSKAQQHQRQLQEEISENSANSGNNSPSSGRKKPASRIQSPRFSRLTGRQGSPDSMISSYHGNTTSDQAFSANHVMPMTTSLIENIKNDALMTQSFDAVTSNNLNSSNATNKNTNAHETTPPRNITPNHYNEQSLAGNPPSGGPLAAASKMVPVPETLMSPDVCPAAVAQRVTVSAITTQMQNSKINKNKDNKMNSPKMRSPHMLKRNSERTPQMSPRKMHSNHSMQSSLSKVSIAQQPTAASPPSVTDNQMKSRLLSNSMHITPPHVGSSGALSSEEENNDEEDDDDDDDSDHINVDKLKTIRNKAAQRCHQQHKENQELANIVANNKSLQHTEQSAVVIQKTWRGYRTRKKTKDIAEKLLKRRTHEYIHKLTKDMEMTKAQLENERKIQQLQMQAINALWKKVSTMQAGAGGIALTGSNHTAESAPTELESASSKTITLDNSSTTVVNDLAKTCTVLTNQVQQLQGSMRDILNCLTLFCNLPHENIKKLLSVGVADALAVAKKEDSSAATTQTEIVAVHTPQFENQTHFPFNNKIRPSTLPLEMQAAMSSTATTIAESNEEPESSLNDESGVASDTVLEKTDEEKPDDKQQLKVC